MEFVFDDMQLTLGDDAKKLLSSKNTHLDLEELYKSEIGYDPELWQEMCDLGWMGLTLPEEYDGAELTFIDLAPILIEMGRHVVPGPFIETVVIFNELILGYGSEDQKKEYLAKVQEGTKASLAYLESNGSWNPTTLKVLSSREGKITGTKEMVYWAEQSDYLMVMANVAGAGPSMFLVPKDDPGVQILPSVGMDVGAKQYTVEFSDAQGELVGNFGDGIAIADDIIFNKAAAAAALDILGSGEALLDLTVTQLIERVQYGKPIGTAQALQHEAANMLIKLEQGKSLSYYGAMAIGNCQGDTALAVSRAKGFMGENIRKIGQLTIQLHGANGFSWEFDIHLFLKRIIRLSYSYGTAADHFERIISLS